MPRAVPLDTAADGVAAEPGEPHRKLSQAPAAVTQGPFSVAAHTCSSGRGGMCARVHREYTSAPRISLSCAVVVGAGVVAGVAAGRRHYSGGKLERAASLGVRESRAPLRW
eukprot:scaffold273_cov349-Prasinococcus_capsulatus_cf.AAC.15